MRHRPLLVLGILTALALALLGCGSTAGTREPQPSVSNPTSANAPALYVHTFLDRWAQATGDPYQLFKFEVSDGRGDAAYLSLKATIPSDPPDEARVVQVLGVASKATGRVVELEVFRTPVGNHFSEERLAWMRPFYDALIGVMEPQLTADERRAILAELKVVGTSAEELKAVLVAGNVPAVRRPGIEYRLEHFGSEEGGTVALRAIVQEHQ